MINLNSNFMEDDLKKEIIEMRYQTFREGFCKFKDFNKFDVFVERCLKNGINQLLNDEIVAIKDFVKFDINKTLLQNYKKTISEKMHPQDVKLNIAKMFAFNLDNEIVKDLIKEDKYCLEIIKKELVDNELFEQCEKINKMLINKQNYEKANL